MAMGHARLHLHYFLRSRKRDQIFYFTTRVYKFHTRSDLGRSTVFHSTHRCCSESVPACKPGMRCPPPGRFDSVKLTLLHFLLPGLLPDPARRAETCSHQQPPRGANGNAVIPRTSCAPTYIRLWRKPRSCPSRKSANVDLPILSHSCVM